ncbi:TolC family protein [Parabacteroides sp. FAFU027]|uniref:TolC family protein n=1 Tax=Parabacteroides sp. FAFU027 TaxID=2922715 RepID=UPI001FAF3906|nr:TolC family protein [Parabacteroides sp. FAFU027]
MSLNKRKSVIVWFLSALLFAPSLWAQEKSLSLDEAKRIALAYNKTLQNARLDVTIAKKKVFETTAIGLPQVTGKADYQHIFKVPSFPMGDTKIPVTFGDNTVFTLQVSQLIFSGEYLVGLQASKVYKAISEQALTKNNIEIGASVESTYYLALILAENLNIVRKNQTVMEQMLNQMEQMHKGGFIEETDVDQLRVNQTTVNNLAIALEGQMKTVHNQLKYLMGMNMSEQLLLTDKLDNVITGINPIANTEFNPGQNIDFKMMENQVAAQKLMLKREQTGYLPTIAGFYQHQEKQKTPILDFQPKDVLGVSLSLPILTSGSRSMKVKQAKLELEKVQNSKEQLKEGLSLKYQSQKLSYETAYNTFLNQQKSTEISNKIYEKTMVKYKAGVSSSLDLTQVQSQYLKSVGDYYNAVLNLLNAKVELEKLAQ